MSENFSLPEQSKILQQVSAKSAFRIIVGVSLAALLFLVWLIYWKEGAANSYPWVPYLPALNAAFNSLSTVFLLLGLNEIRKRNFSRHMKFMTSAFIASALFLTSYVIYHHFQGEVHDGRHYQLCVFLYSDHAHCVIRFCSAFSSLQFLSSPHRKIPKTPQSL